jgi:hypothetical protein
LGSVFALNETLHLNVPLNAVTSVYYFALRIYTVWSRSGPRTGRGEQMRENLDR